MPEKFLYNLQEAQEEAAKIKTKIQNDETNDYTEAEKLVEKEKQAKKEIVECLNLSSNECGIGRIIKIKNNANLSADIIRSQEIQSAAEERMIRELGGGCINCAIRIKDNFNIQESIIRSQEIQSIAKKRMEKCLDTVNSFSLNDKKARTYWVDQAIKINNSFNVS